MGRYVMTTMKWSESVSKAVSCLPTGVTVLVWDRNESLINNRHKQEHTLTSADSLRGQRRRQQRSSSGPAADAKLKKKLASLEESGTKTKTSAGCTKQKLAQMRKK